MKRKYRWKRQKETYSIDLEDSLDQDQLVNTSIRISLNLNTFKSELPDIPSVLPLTFTASARDPSNMTNLIKPLL